MECYASRAGMIQNFSQVWTQDSFQHFKAQSKILIGLFKRTDSKSECRIKIFDDSKRGSKVESRF